MVARLDVVHAGADLDDLAAPSWPSTIGVGRGRSPFSSDRSEWQRPGRRPP
jgi:hypothetical protein